MHIYKQKNDLSNEKFGRLTVIDFSHNNKRSFWNCICDCGNKLIVNQNKLTTGNTKSCGCLRTELKKERMTKHNYSKTSTYHIWQGVIDRCNNNKNYRYKYYGGRGITVCDKWLTFEGFYEDMGDRPGVLTLDRKDNNGNYCKDNCRWATEEEQKNNKRNNINITYDNKTQTLALWSRELDIGRGTLYHRLFKLKWTEEKTFNTLVKGKNKI